MAQVKLGPVAHFRLAVRNPEASATWWTGHFDLVERFRTDDRIAIGNDAILIALSSGEPDPAVVEHMAFLVNDIGALQAARDALKTSGVELEDPGDEIGPVAPGSKSLGLWFRDLDGYRWELFLPAASLET
jgi:catechol 2,3-dioxygenase-like lactoylglutathione lyase family enzyme